MLGDSGTRVVASTPVAAVVTGQIECDDDTAAAVAGAAQHGLAIDGCESLVVITPCDDPVHGAAIRAARQTRSTVICNGSSTTDTLETIRSLLEQHGLRMTPVHRLCAKFGWRKDRED